jgi:hypothetical protein
VPDLPRTAARRGGGTPVVGQHGNRCHHKSGAQGRGGVFGDQKNGNKGVLGSYKGARSGWSSRGATASSTSGGGREGSGDSGDFTL